MISFKRLLGFQFLFVGAFLFTSCHWNNASYQHTVVIKVDSKELTSKQFADELAQRLSKYDSFMAKDTKIVAQTKESIINDFIVSSILQNWAQKHNIQIDKEKIESEKKAIRSDFPDDFSFREELSRQGLSVHQWQKTVENRLIEKAVFESLQKEIPPPSEESIQKYYESNKHKYKNQDKIYLQQIVLSEKADAEKIASSLKKGKSFESLAKQFSIAPENKNGGIVGWVEKGTLEVFDKAFLLPLGEPSEVIQSPYGYHIMLVVKKAPSGITPLTMVRNSIKRELASQTDQLYFKTWLSQQIRSINVFKDQKLIDTMSVETHQE